MAELVVLALLTADFAADARARRTITRVIAGSALLTVGLGALGLVLFYLGVRTGLVGAYGEQYTPSHLFTRIQAGFESPPLLASFCIFGSGVLAAEEAGVGRGVRRAGQVALFLLCLATFSRGVIGFLVAVALRRAAAMRGRRAIALGLVATVAGVSVIALLTIGRLHVAPGRPSVSYSAPDPGNRREAFVTSLGTLGRHPVFGIGPGALPGENAGTPFRAHFTPLNIAATLGLPALTALVLAIWLLWRGRRRPTDRALWSAAAGVLLDGLAQDIDHFRHVWVLIGLLDGRRESS